MSLFSDTQELLDDAGVFYTDALLYAKLNEAQYVVWPKTMHSMGDDLALQLTGTSTFAVPSSIYVPKHVYAGGRRYPVISYWTIERESREWKQWEAGQPKAFMMLDCRTLEAAPTPDQNRYVQVYGVLYPTETISASTLTLTAPRDVLDAVMFQAAALCAAPTRTDLQQVWEAASEEAAMRMRSRSQNISHQALRPAMSSATLYGMEYRVQNPYPS